MLDLDGRALDPACRDSVNPHRVSDQPCECERNRKGHDGGDTYGTRKVGNGQIERTRVTIPMVGRVMGINRVLDGSSMRIQRVERRVGARLAEKRFLYYGQQGAPNLPLAVECLPIRDIQNIQNRTNIRVRGGFAEYNIWIKPPTRFIHLIHKRE